MTDMSTGQELYRAVDGLVLGTMDRRGVSRELLPHVGKISLMETADNVDGVRRYRMLDIIPGYDDDPPAHWVCLKEGADDLAPHDNDIKIMVQENGGLLVLKRLITRQEVPNDKVVRYLSGHVLPTIGNAAQVNIDLEWDDDKKD